MEKLGIVPEGLHGVLRVRAGEDLRPPGPTRLATRRASRRERRSRSGDGRECAAPFPKRR